MNHFDQVINAKTEGRVNNLQALLKHFLQLHPSLAEQLDSLTTASDRTTFSQLSQHKQENILEDCVVSLFHRICDNGKKTVLIHSSGALRNNRVIQFCGPDIVERLRSTGYNSWIIDGVNINDSFLSFDKTLLERMNFISLILVEPWGLTLDYNKDTKTFKLPFSASLAPEWEDSILLNDFFYVPNHRTTTRLFDRYRKSVPLPRDNTRHRRTFTAIPVGSLKNYRIRRARQAIRPEDRNKILFCAEAYDYANSVAKTYGITLIRKILNRFPDNTIVYRPHPNWVNDSISRNIRESFADEQRFLFDSNSSSEEIMASGCALITDGSLSGLTYCVAASRPSVYFNPWQLSTHFDSNVVGFDFEDGKLFRFTSSIDETLDALQDLVADPSKEFEEITELAGKAYAHPDDGLDYLLSSVQAIVEDQTLPDWKTFEISEDEVGNESAADYAGLLRNDLLRFPEFYRVLSKDLSALTDYHDVITCMINKSQSHRLGHLQSITRNFNALVSGMETYGCSGTAIKMIDLLFEPIMERGNRDDVSTAINLLRKVYSILSCDVQNGIDGSHLMESFSSSSAGKTLSNVKKATDPIEIMSLIAESRLALTVPSGLVSIVRMQSNEVCELSFTCRKCGFEKSINLQLWFSYNEVCESCDTLNHIDPFEKALHLPEVFFARLPFDGNVVLWGAGGFYYKLMQKYDGLSSDRFLLVDVKETQQGLSICRKKVHPPDVITLNNIKTVIITALSRKDEIHALLCENYPSVKNVFALALDVTEEGVVPFLNRL